MIFTFVQFSMGDAFNYPVFGKCRQPNKQTNKWKKQTHELQCCRGKNAIAQLGGTINLASKFSLFYLFRLTDTHIQNNSTKEASTRACDKVQVANDDSESNEA